MTINDYDELKRKYDALLEENKALKVKIRELAPKSENIISLHKPVQSGETVCKHLKNLASNPKSDAAVSGGTYAGLVSRFSQNDQKIDLLMSLFRGRSDVYAKKWQSKKGASGYSPVCLNEWVPGICNKPRIKCSACGNQSYGTLNKSVKDDFFPVYLRDIAVASKHVLIISPFVTKQRMLQMMEHFNGLLEKQVKITLITRPANDYDENRKTLLSDLFSTIETGGVQMVYKSNIHQKFAIIDNKLTWYGSINLLSFGYSEETIMRLESSSIASELIESIDMGIFFTPSKCY